MNQLNSPLIDPGAWLLEPGLRFLNHGSFGACPREILEAQDKWRRALERSPVQFYLHHLPDLLAEARARVASVMNASPEGLVFVSNASEGVSTALHSVDWRAGDEVIVSRDSYPACRHMLSELSERLRLNVRVALTPYAVEGGSWSDAVCKAFQAVVSDRTRLILIDHITSPTALVYPVRALVKLARDVGAVSLVDGAHAPAQLDLDLISLDADFYTGNLHKWMFTPKSAAFLSISDRWRDQTRPQVISHGYLSPPAKRLHALFDWVGTRDYSALCVAPFAIDWVRRHGGFDRLRDRNNQLITSARQVISERLWPHGIELPPRHAIAHMAAIPVPDSLAGYTLDEVSSSGEVSSASDGALHPLQIALAHRRYEVPIIHTAHGLMIRISAQAYNTLDQYEQLAETLVGL